MQLNVVLVKQGLSW